jgi:phenylalanine-4-hydroxylase
VRASRVLRTRYRSDAFGQVDFVIDNFDDLLTRLEDAGFLALSDELSEAPGLKPGIALEASNA